MNYKKIAEKIVYENTGERLMLPDLPYQKRLIDAIEKALTSAADDARQSVGRALADVASEGGFDDEAVSAAFRNVGNKLASMTGEDLVNLGLLTIAEEIAAGVQ